MKQVWKTTGVGTRLAYLVMAGMSTRILTGAGGEGAGETRVFSLQTDIWAGPSSEVFLRYNLTGDLPPPPVLTICYRYNIQQYRDGVYFFSYATADHMDNAVLLYQREGTMNLYYNDVEASVSMTLLVPDTMALWHHHCHLIRFPEYRLYVDGRLAGSGVMVGEPRPLHMNGTVYIGQEQDGLASGLDAMQSTSAFMAQVNVWDRLLDEDTISTMASCLVNTLGNVLSSDVHNFEVRGAGEERRSVSSLCQKELEFVIVPEKWHLGPSLEFCRVSNSEMFLPNSDTVNQRLFNETRDFLKQCSGKSYRLLRLGASDTDTDGDWRRLSDDARFSYTAWAPGEPNDGVKSDCIVMKKSLNKWGDVSCKDEYCFSCLKDKDKYLYIRGLCQKKEHHTRFLLDGYVNNRPFFRGYYGLAVFMSKLESWVLRDVLANVTLAEMVKRRTLTTDYPLGRHNWQVVSPFCQQLAGDIVQLSLSSCATQDFMCSDGFCVSRKVRCNLLNDCADGSDEENCDIVEFSEGYRGHRPPAGVTFKDPLVLVPVVNIIRFSNVDDLNLALFIELEIILTWTDRGLKFKNLKPNTENKLSTKEVEKVWQPETEFTNVNDGRLKLLKKTVFVERIGDPAPSLFNDVKMDTVFPAAHGRMVQRTLYSASFSCNYQLFRYPFDTQTCSVFLKLTSATSQVVTFKESSVRYQGLENLPKYKVGSLTASVDRSYPNDRLQATFELHRRYSLLVLTIFLPTILLLGIGYTTLFVRIQLLQVRAIMTLTTLLVLYTLFNQVSAALPDTAYIKMVDMWFFFCIFLIFFLIVVHILAENLSSGVPSTPSPGGGNKVMMVQPPERAGQLLWQPQGTATRAWWWRRITAEVLLRRVRKFVIPVLLVVFNSIFWFLYFI